MNIFLGVIIPFIGTSIGSLLVFVLKNKIGKKLERILLGLASGVMIAASIWSLLIPAIERSKNLGYITWIPVSVGFMMGIIFLIIIDLIVKKINISGRESKLLFLAVTLHNIPEGMAVGTILAALISGNVGITVANALALSVGIAIQNIPEGAIISMPLLSKGHTKLKSFSLGILSGAVEPIFAIITILLTNLIVPFLPYLLSFAAGAMIYVVVHELIPDSSKEDNNITPFSVGIGFIIMMILDITLS